MNCPFCGKEMQKGFIPSGRDVLVWRSDELLERDVYLTNFPLMRMQNVTAFYCADCRQIIVPVPELESFSDKMKEKMDAVKEKFTAVKDDFSEQREEKQNERKQKKRAGKDPWEW